MTESTQNIAKAAPKNSSFQVSIGFPHVKKQTGQSYLGRAGRPHMGGGETQAEIARLFNVGESTGRYPFSHQTPMLGQERDKSR
jgi:hypothetical protein